jgi:hypothetical protein
MNSRIEINPLYKLSDGGLQFTSNALPTRPLFRSNKGFLFFFKTIKKKDFT